MALERLVKTAAAVERRAVAVMIAAAFAVTVATLLATADLSWSDEAIAALAGVRSWRR